MGRTLKISKKIDDGNTIKVSNGKNHVLIRSADDLILNGKKMDKFNIYSASGKLHIDRLAESEQEFVAESIEREVRLLAANLISALTLTFQPESDLQDKKFMQSLQYIKKILNKGIRNSRAWDNPNDCTMDSPPLNPLSLIYGITNVVPIFHYV